MDWGFQRLDGDILIPRQLSSGTGKPDPALNTLFCPQKMASRVKFPLCVTNVFTINAGNLFEGYQGCDLLHLGFALFSTHSSACKNTFHCGTYYVEFGGMAGGEKTWKKNESKEYSF